MPPTAVTPPELAPPLDDVVLVAVVPPEAVVPPVATVPPCAVAPPDELGLPPPEPPQPALNDTDTSRATQTPRMETSVSLT